jgi:TatD DNase family protein
MIFDTHAHYDDVKFDTDRYELLDGLFGSSVSGVLNCATATENFSATLELCGKYEKVYAALGIHPSDCYRYESLSDSLQILSDTVKKNDVRALGEIGLDYHYDFSPRDVQLAYFKAQLELAENLGLPAVIQYREAHGDVFEQLRGFRGTAVIHSCSESAETVRQLCRKGHYISFSGSVTFKNASSVREAAKAVPDELLLVETDAPYMAPVPVRGQRNDSGNIKYIISVLAGIRGDTAGNIERITEENAKKLFKIG